MLSVRIRTFRERPQCGIRGIKKNYEQTFIVTYCTVDRCEKFQVGFLKKRFGRCGHYMWDRTDVKDPESSRGIMGWQEYVLTLA